MDLLEFAKKFTTFKPTSYHETFFKMIEESIEKGESIQPIDTTIYRRWYKDLKLNEFIYSYLIKMAKGQTFALATPGGIHIFKKIEFRDQQGEIHEH